MKKILILGFCTLYLGCATYQSKVAEFRDLVAARKLDQAEKKIVDLALKKSDDQLVYLLDYAVVLQMQGDIQKSNQMFFKALNLVEEQDYESLSRVAGSLLLNEEVIQYKGDTFEKIFIHAYLAMNFLSLQDLDSALVEARRINDKYKKYRADQKKDIQQISFGKYLSALIWEAAKQYDDAYIAYVDAFNLDNNIMGIKNDILRMAKKSNRQDDFLRWQKQWNIKYENDLLAKDKNMGEVIVLFQQGWGPRKYFNRYNSFLPLLKSTFSETQYAEIQLNLNKNFKTQLIYDVNLAAQKTLKEDQDYLVAKRVGSFVSKEIVADQIRQKNEALGAIAWIAMHASERADLRQWSTLPESIQMVRFKLPTGKHEIKIQGFNQQGLPVDESHTEQIYIRPSTPYFLVWRSVK